MSLSQKDQSVQAFRFDRAHKPLRDGIAPRNPWWTEHDLDPGRFENLSGSSAVFCVSANDQMSLAASKAVHPIGQMASYLFHPLRVGRDRDAAHLNQGMNSAFAF